MKLLLLSDLHGRLDWLAWASSQKADALLIAGDLLDGFDPAGLLPQQIAFLRWARACRIPLAFSSGNHDANEIGAALGGEVPDIGGLTDSDKELVGQFFTVERWMDLAERPGVIPDARSEILHTRGGQIVVTTVPFDSPAGKASQVLWERGAALRSQHRLPWIVLHHEPPPGTEVGGPAGDSGLLRRIREHRPDFLLCGHLHDRPWRL